MRLASTLCLLLTATAPQAQTDDPARPVPRPAPPAPAPVDAPQVVPDAGLSAWIADFRPRALAQGISAATFDAAFAGVGLVPDSIARDRNQAEFVRGLGDYLSTAVSDTRVATGRAMLVDHADLLSRIEAAYGVDRHVVLAIWGMESNFGARRGDVPLIATLATLAYEGRRGAFFTEQLLAALTILQRGDIAPSQMTGSWAGAMGHTQFIPTSYAAYAVDFTGDGRRDIWSDDPSDALASAAAYLAAFDWTTGQPWGAEALLPAGFDFALADGRTARSVRDWAARGVTVAGGAALPDAAQARLIAPTGADGPAFLTLSNADVIRRYNNATAYVIGVGHLADRIRGGDAFVTPFRPDARDLTRDERQELQQRLTDAGFDTGGVDGVIGPATRRAIRAWQVAQDATPDGFASYRLLLTMR